MVVRGIGARAAGHPSQVCSYYFGHFQKVRMEGGKLLPLPLSPPAGCGMKGLSIDWQWGKVNVEEKKILCVLFIWRARSVGLERGIKCYVAGKNRSRSMHVATWACTIGCNRRVSRLMLGWDIASNALASCELQILRASPADALY